MSPRKALSFGLAALAFALPLSIAGTNTALAMVSFAWLWLLARDRDAAWGALKATARSPVFLALSVYAAWALICCLAGLDSAASLRVWPKDLHKLWAFLAIGSALAAAETPSLLAPLGAGLGLHAAVGVGQAASEWISGAEQVRAHGFLHPVSYAAVMGLGLLGAAAWLMRPRTQAPSKHHGVGIALLALLSTAFIVAQTRAVLGGLAAAYAAACALESRWRRHAWAVVLVLCAIVVFWEAMPTGGRSIRNLISVEGSTSEHRSRLVLWNIALQAAHDHPLTGVGPGGYRQAFRNYHPDELDGEQSWGNAHNLYLHQLAERGVTGLAILLVVLGTLVVGAWRANLARRDAGSLWAVMAAAAFLVMNLTETAWQTEQVATFLIFIWLLGAGPRPAREIL